MNDTPTPRTDLLTAKHWGDGFAAQYLKPEMQAMERELTAAREELAGLRSVIDYASKELSKTTEQRDRLAEQLAALSKPTDLIHNGVGIADLYAPSEFEKEMNADGLGRRALDADSK